MPTVPTVDAPTQSASGSPLSISAPPETFGANVVVEGLSKLGSVSAETSQMLQQHAEQFQAINNKAESDKGFSTFVPASAQLWENYKAANQGDLAAKNLPEFYTKLEALRTNISGSMSNPMARAMYDASSRQEFRTLSNEGANYAAAQTNKYALDQHNASQKTYMGLMAADPSPENYEKNKQSLLLNQALWDHTHGVSEEAGKLNVGTLLAKAVAETTGIIANSGDPVAANAFFQAHKADMALDPLAIKQVEAALRPILQAVQVRAAANTYVGRAAMSAAPGDLHGYYTAQGWTPEQAAGIAANLNEESGGSANPKGSNDGGAAYGLAQWHADRQADFAKWAGHSIQDSTLDEQKAFVNYELTQGKYKAVGDQLRNAKTPEDAAAIVMRGYERPADQSAAAVAGRGVTARQIAEGATTSSNPQLSRMDAIERNAPAEFARIASDPQWHGDAALIEKAQSAFLNNINQEKAVTNLAQSAAKERLVAVAQASGATSIAQLSAQPGVADDLRLLSPEAQRTLDHQLTADGNRWDPVKNDRYVELHGMSTANPQQFLATDLSKEALPLAAIRSLSNLQDKIAHKADAATSASKILNQMTTGNAPEWKSIVRAQGLKPNTTGYFHLVGSVQSELEKWQDANPNKVPSAADRMGILARASAVTGSYRESFLGIPFGASHLNTDTDHAGVRSAHVYDVTPQERTRATAILRGSGQPVDEQAIARTTQLFLRGGR